MPLYHLSGSTDVVGVHKLLDDRDLARVIERCTAFSPGDRYQDTASFRRALRRARKQEARRWVAWMAVAAVVALCAGFFPGSQHRYDRLVRTGVIDLEAVAFVAAVRRPLLHARVPSKTCKSNAKLFSFVLSNSQDISTNTIACPIKR